MAEDHSSLVSLFGSDLQMLHCCCRHCAGESDVAGLGTVGCMQDEDHYKKGQEERAVWSEA